MLDATKSSAVINGLQILDYPDLIAGASAQRDSSNIALVLVENEVTVDAKFDDWKDVTGERYHFPNQYRNQFVEGRRFVYYRGVRRAAGVRGTPEYFGTGTIGEIWRDSDIPEDSPKVRWKWFCNIEDYEPLQNPVPAKIEGKPFEDIADNLWGVGVRPLSRRVLEEILKSAGLSPPPPPLTANSVPKVPNLEDVTPSSASGLLVPRKPSKGDKAKKGASSGGRRSRYSALVGRRGEEIALKYLRESLDETAAASLRWVSEAGEKPGWDIEYTDSDGNLIAVEVKATTGPSFPSIEVTANEWEAALERRDHFKLILVTKALTDHPPVVQLKNPAALAERGELFITPTVFRLEATMNANA